MALALRLNQQARDSDEQALVAAVRAGDDRAFEQLYARYRARIAAGKAKPGNGLIDRIPSAATLDKLTYRTVVFGFPVWTFGVIAGAIWADQAWGRYWGWDPVETWAFITWVIYAAYLHARATAGWRGARAHYIQLLGFASLVTNMLVVQVFITGMHSYAGVN